MSLITRLSSSDPRAGIGEKTGEWRPALGDEFREGPILRIGGGDDAELRPLEVGWTRIGRSPLADIQLDDPSVSRRHALLIRTDQGALRVLDDRSLNGIFVNGRQVEWAPLSDGDELVVGAAARLPA